MKMLDYVCATTSEYIACMPKVQRKKYGQFFTSKEVAVFMADLFTIPEDFKSISILDPGAGSGILSTAILERIEKIPTIESVELVCYENDASVVELLRSNLEYVCQQSAKHIFYKIVTDNYILSQADEYNDMFFGSGDLRKFDFVIGNPPYMKIAKSTSEAAAMSNVCSGAPNLYFLFASMSLFNLKKNGEMVYIIPRSWTSGAYFKQFRKYLLTNGVLEHIHLFVGRNNVFEKENVLQETIIIKVKKTQIIPDEVLITTTHNGTDFSNQTVFAAPYSTVVNGQDFYVYLVTSSEDIQALSQLNRWTATLPALGLKMKTGITVDFRNRKMLRASNGENVVPLFYSQHIQKGQVVFPVGKEYEYITTSENGLLQKNTNYLFVKRFTSKEERRRLQCGVYLSRKFPQYAKISTQNKINFICGLYELSESVVYGLYVLFNSTLYDNYYRILNGSTQVNSTEINTLPVPAIDIIEAMGKDLISIKDMSVRTCDNILRSYV